MEYSGVQVRKRDSPVNVRFNFGRQKYIFEFLKCLSLECIPAMPFR